jgi:hypothetical protein
MKRVTVVIGLLIAGLVMPLPAAELPQVKELMVVGSGETIGGDVGKARQSAIMNALKEAVRISLMEFIPSSVLEENDMALHTEIFSRVTQYVQTFKILSETGKADRHEVLLQVQIDLHKLRDSLASMGLLEERVVEEEVVRVRLVLAEVSRYPWYREFEDFLRKDLGFVRDVRLRYVMMGEFTVDVELVGDIQSLLDALRTTEFEEFSLEIDHGFEEQVMVRFRSREPSGS